MSFPRLFSLKHQVITISFSLLLLLLLKFVGCCICSFSSALLLSILPISFPFIFSKIRQLMITPGSAEEPTPELKLSPEEEEIAEENKSITREEDGELQIDEIVLTDEGPSSENANPVSENSTFDENLETLSCSPLEKSDPVVSDDDSDDESLIEITLEDEPNAPQLNHELKRSLLPESLPEFPRELLLFRNHGLMELLSEINEEDNMIEIDITMGSIKCSRFEIKA